DMLIFNCANHVNFYFIKQPQAEVLERSPQQCMGIKKIAGMCSANETKDHRILGGIGCQLALAKC
ncbi:MAG: hypothetical protein Q4A68_04905, partial [Anaerobiospirillum succiniciproducens]|uniref:hypothetical protein n=1 Tax=Anaerobiospirillum succiniciproducens TaxID=13335 RepID=UPI0026DD8AD9